MSKIDFYITNPTDNANRDIVACRLSEKAYRHKLSVFIKVDEHAMVKRLDDLMWTFRDGSFVPHAAADSEHASESPVVIGSTPTVGRQFDMLINLGNAFPTNYGDFKRVAEIVDPDPASKQVLRERFKQYRHDGNTPSTHQL